MLSTVDGQHWRLANWDGKEGTLIIGNLLTRLNQQLQDETCIKDTSNNWVVSHRNRSKKRSRIKIPNLALHESEVQYRYSKTYC